MVAVQPRRILWRLAEVIEVVAETPRTKSLLLEVVSVAKIEEGEAHDGRKMDALDARFEALPEREQQELLRLMEAVAEAEPLEPAAERPEDAIPPGLAAELRRRARPRQSEEERR